MFTGAGSPSSAFATLRRAQLAVRQVSRSRQAASVDETQTPLATVSLRSAGIHWVHRGINATVALQSAPAPLTFSGPDSGTAQHHVVWRTHPSDAGSAVVSAGFPVPQKWKPTAADPGLYEVHVPDVAAGFACPQQLWAGEKRLTRARLPHTGFLQWVSALNPTNYSDKMNSHGFVYSPEFAPTAAEILAAHTGNTLRAANITVVTMHIWGDSHSILDSINVTARSLHWIAPSSTPIGLYESGMPGSTGRRFFLDNTALGLDAAGSWHIDCDSGLMRYRPRGGEDPNAMEFVAAGANEVVVFGNPADKDIGAAHSLHGAIERHKLAYLPTMRHSDTVDPCGDPAREVRSASNRVAIAHSANAQSTTKDMIASNIVLENLVLSHNNYACPTGRACGGSDAGFQVRQNPECGPQTVFSLNLKSMLEYAFLSHSCCFHDCVEHRGPTNCARCERHHFGGRCGAHKLLRRLAAGGHQQPVCQPLPGRPWYRGVAYRRGQCRFGQSHDSRL